MESKLDPREVLSHLNKMGYHNITAEQLRDFTRDLKKLIRFDQLQCDCPRSSKNSGVSFVEMPQDRRFHQFASDPASFKPKDDGRIRHPCKEISVPQKQSRPKSAFVLSPWCDESDDMSVTSSTLSSTSNLCIDRTDLPIRYSGKGRGKARCASAENLHDPPKPRQSFIKPWRLLEPAPQPRSDPVALYHKYQEIWRQQKAPGESSHQGLRWSVREKMLGQDPNPRPMSRNTSHDAVWRRRKLR